MVYLNFIEFYILNPVGITLLRREGEKSPSRRFFCMTPLLRFLGRWTGEGEGRGVTGSQSLSAVTGGEETVWGRNSVLGHRLFKLER